MLVITTLVVAAALAQAPAGAHPLAATTSMREVRTSATIVPAESSLIGTIETFEQAARRLVLQTKDARVSFVLAADAVVRLGSRTLPAAELASHRGRRAKVRYTQAGTRRTAHWVVISSERN